MFGCTHNRATTAERFEPSGASSNSSSATYPRIARGFGSKILERLVALNAERAEEERNGLVRWLRPEFQNPSGAKAATAWPKKLPERIAAVRDLVAGGRGAWSIEQVVAAFGGAKRDDVEELIESLAGLGILVAYGEATARRYRASGRVAA